MKHIVLLGDSILDNGSYVGGGLDVVAHLRKLMPQYWKATLGAVDGSIVENVRSQLTALPADATHLVVSVGGNNALMNSDILQARVTSSVEVFDQLADRAAVFEKNYRAMLQALSNVGKPFALCTIYYPRMQDAFTQKIAVAALATFNH